MRIWPGALRGEVRAVPSKSYAHRALLCALLAGEECSVELEGLNDDIRSTMGCLRALGAGVEESPTNLRVLPGILPENPALDCGESGSTLRFLLPILAALGKGASFFGAGRLPERPLEPLLGQLRQKGIRFEGERLPLRMEGRLRPGAFELPGNISSQYVTGLLLALPVLEWESKIRLTSVLESAPYAQMTLDVLASFGVRAVKIKEGFAVPGGQRFRSPGRYRVEGDWSQAAFWVAANALGSQIKIAGLSAQSAQGDRAILELTPRVLAGNSEINLSDCPDLAPILCVVAALSPGNARVTGIERLRLKESDRIACTLACLRAVGAKIIETDHGLLINGKERLRGGEADCFGDHRLAMALAIAALRCESAVTILGAEAVNKSYPRFFEDFMSLGGKADAL